MNQLTPHQREAIERLNRQTSPLLGRKRPATFAEWLHRQTYRSDPIGDLARDCAPSAVRRHWDVDRVRQDLDDHAAAPGAYAALDRAAAEYAAAMAAIRPTTARE